MIRFGIKSGNLDGALNRRGLLKVFRTYHPYIQDQCGWCCNAVICTSLKLLALECHYSPGPFPHVTAVNISGTLRKETPLFTLDLTHFVSGSWELGDVSLASLLFGSIVSAKSWAVRGTSRYQLLVDKGLGDILGC